MTGADIAHAAEALVGCPFRLHGRDPQTGLDCIGLLQAVFRAIGIKADLPSGYSLRTSRWPGLGLFASDLGFDLIEGGIEPGDVCLFQPSPAQLHFAVAASGRDRFVEAHAGLRRVVISPGPYPHALLRQWRLIAPEN
ncbi:MAG: NlpC/P60 family protein [Novosphingobium sp.]